MLFLKRTLFCIALLISVSALHGQIRLDDPNIIFKDEKGKVLTSKEVQLILATGGAGMQQRSLPDGKTEITFIVKSEDEAKESEEEKLNFIKKWINKPHPKFDFNDIEGHNLNSDQLKGKVIVFNYWFIGCKPCIAEMPELNRLVEKYKDKDVVFIAPSGFDNKESITKFLTQFRFTYQIVADAKEYAVDRMGIMTYPTHFVVDKLGVINELIIGNRDNTIELLDKAIESVVK